MASSSRQSINPEKKFVTGNIGTKLMMASVMLQLEDRRWCGTVVAQRESKLVVLTVAEVLFSTWESIEQVQENLKAQFYNDPQKYPCKIAVYDPESNIALLVVDNCTTKVCKLNFAPEKEWNLKALQYLGCRGHEWRIATGKVCYPELPDKIRRKELDKDNSQMVYFGHKLDLRVGYLGAGLVNEKGNIVGMHMKVPVDLFYALKGIPLRHQILDKKRELNRAICAAEFHMDKRAKEKELEELNAALKDVSINSTDLLFEQHDSSCIPVPISQAKIAIHVKCMHRILKKNLKAEGQIEKSLEKALEDLIGSSRSV